MKHSYKKFLLGVRALLIIGLVALTGSSLIGIKSASAVDLVDAADVLSTISASTNANHIVQWDGSADTAVAVGETIILDFTTGFNDASVDAIVTGDVDLEIGSVAECDTATFTDEPVATDFTFTNNANQTLTITKANDTIAANLCTRILIGTNATEGTAGVNQIQNGAASSHSVVISGTWGNTANIGIDIIADDQVQVSATVPGTITCTLSNNSVGFGNLSPAASRWATSAGTGSGADTTGYSITNATNAVGGLRITIDDQTTDQTLSDGLGNLIEAIEPSATLSIGTDQFGLYVAADNVAVNEVSPYDNAGGVYAYITADFPDVVAQSTGFTASNTVDYHLAANVAASTPAGLYTTTITNVCTGYF